jgi:hypothetical protein
VARRHRRPPAADRKDRDVEVVDKVAHAREQVGIAREVDGTRSPEHEAERRRVSSPRPPDVVLGMDRSHLQRPDRDDLTRIELDDVFKAVAPDEPTGSARQNEPDPATEFFQRAEIEVIPVDVGDECRVHAKLAGSDRRTPPEKQNLSTQYRVGEHARPVELDEDGL